MDNNKSDLPAPSEQIPGRNFLFTKYTVEQVCKIPSVSKLKQRKKKMQKVARSRGGPCKKLHLIKCETMHTRVAPFNFSRIRHKIHP